jgi:[acyl-carrier-protein] S-malonyltransferase
MASVQPKLRRELAEIPLHLPSIPVISNVTSRPHGTPEEIHQRLVEQVVAPVRWEESIRHLLGEGFRRFIELGPGTALSGFTKRINKDAEILNVADPASLEATVRALSLSIAVDSAP